MVTTLNDKFLPTAGKALLMVVVQKRPNAGVMLSLLLLMLYIRSPEFRGVEITGGRELAGDILSWVVLGLMVALFAYRKDRADYSKQMAEIMVWTAAVVGGISGWLYYKYTVDSVFADTDFALMISPLLTLLMTTSAALLIGAVSYYAQAQLRDRSKERPLAPVANTTGGEHAAG